MANTIAKYTDAQIMKCLLTQDFTGIGGEFIDDVLTSVKPGAFFEAQNLNKVSLPALREVRYQSFANTHIGTLDIPWEKLEIIGYGAFMGADGIPENLNLNKVTVLNNAAFMGSSSARNTQIRTVSLPLWTGSTKTENGFGNNTNGAFAYCSAMTSFSAPMLQTIPNQMLYYCSALEEVYFPKVTTINSGAFSYCTKLKKIDIGGAVTKMSSAFLNSTTALQALIFSGITSVPTITSSTFSSCNISKKTAYVYVPKSLEATFKVANNWSTYATQIRAIEDYPDICGS